MSESFRMLCYILDRALLVWRDKRLANVLAQVRSRHEYCFDVRNEVRKIDKGNQDLGRDSI